MLTDLRAMLKKITGTVAPLKSLTFWGLLLWYGVPDAVGQTFGVDLKGLDAWGQKLAPALLALGIRRRL